MSLTKLRGRVDSAARPDVASAANHSVPKNRVKNFCITPNQRSNEGEFSVPRFDAKKGVNEACGGRLTCVTMEA